ncbi:hypothetical protein NP493_820g00002 [Ridgeia piscesae]|uniref:Uncharacterized protein n=1 Tax=Ridgeia piscesae TaxID=27915 RepID=A0AAD9KM91_RIDPI|nr:hypothetical protein NP493_820g00002 [Ridgeia piscesae]
MRHPCGERLCADCGNAVLKAKKGRKRRRETAVVRDRREHGGQGETMDGETLLSTIHGLAKIFDSPKECKGDDSQTEGLRLRTQCRVARKQPSDDKQRFDLQHRRGVYPPAALPTEPSPHASTSTNSVCFTRSMKSADINCPEQSRHIRSRTSPLLQQSSHHVKWLLPLAHQKMTKEAVSECVVLCQKQTEHMARFCKHFTVDFRFGAECSKGISLEL